MKKKILLVCAILVALLALSSCSFFGGNDNSTPTPSGSEKISQIVLYDTGMDILDFRSKIYDLTGIIAVVAQDEPAKECEIVFGDTNRAVTALAKAELEKLESGKSSADYGYIIYYDGKSVAIYWDHENLRDLAVNKFVSECLDKLKLKMSEGTVASATYTAKETIEEALWMALEEVATPEVYAALRKHNNYLDGSTMLAWMANLWDGDIGGFYFSNTARDNEPYRPDIESTEWIMSFLKSSGAMNSVNNELPHEIKTKIVDFALSLQHSDGYFYHPQWPIGTDKLQTDRYGRDLTNAMSIINRFTIDRDGDGVEEKQYPKYCTPNGYKCAAHALDGGSCNLSLTTAQGGLPLSGINAAVSITTSSSLAVSKISGSVVKPTAAASDKPDYSSPTAFKAWLEVYNATLRENSGKAHNLNALAGEIRAHGYNDIVLDMLQTAQREIYEEQTARGEEPTGFWQYTADLKCVWGMHKYIGYYSTAKASLTYHKEMVKTIVKVIAIDPSTITSYALNDHMNQWVAINHVISNAKTYNPDVVPELYEIVRENVVDLIDNSIERLRPMNLGDGMFVYSYSGRAPSSIYGTPISKGIAEADVNGMLLLGNYYNAVFESLGYTKIPLCSAIDGEEFVDTILNCEPIEKIPLPKAEVLDFEKGSLGNRVSMNNNNATASITIEADPEDSSNSALMFYSPSATANDGDHLIITASNSGGNCAIAEFDMYVETAPATRFIQLKLGDSIMLEFIVSGQYLTIRMASAYSSARYDNLLTTTHQVKAFGEWHRIRVEMYDPEEDDDTGTPHIKLFVDDEFIKESTCYMGVESGKTFKGSYDAVDFYSLKSVESLVYVDNLFLNKEYKEYTPDDHDISDSRS